MQILSTAILMVFLSCLSVSVLAADSSKMSYRQNKIIYQAQKALEVGDAQQCTRIVLQYLDEQEATPYQFYSLLGTCQYQLQDFSAATRAFATAFSQEPENPEISSALATSLYLHEDYTAAAKQFAVTYQLSTDKEPQLLYQSAVAFYMAKDFRQAVTALKQLVKESNADDSSWNELLLSCYLELKEWTEAQQHLQQLLQQKPEHEPYWRLLAQLYLQQKDYRQAAFAMEIVSRLQPSAAEDLKFLAGLYNYLNIPLRAADLLAQAYGPAPLPQQVEELAGLYLRGYDYSKAMTVIEMGLQRWPDSVPLGSLLTQLLYQQGRYQDVLKSTAAGSEQSLLKGYAAWHLGRWTEARKFFLQAASDKRYHAQSRHALEVLELLLQAAAEDVDGRQSYARLHQ